MAREEHGSQVVCQILNPVERDELVTSLDRNSKGEPSALASQTATLREHCCSTGPSDKWPVITQACRMMNVASTTNVLPGSGFSPRTPYVQLERCPVGELSLSTEAECLSLQSDCSANAQNVQEEGYPSADAVLSGVGTGVRRVRT